MPDSWGIDAAPKTVDEPGISTDEAASGGLINTDGVPSDASDAAGAPETGKVWGNARTAELPMVVS